MLTILEIRLTSKVKLAYRKRQHALCEGDAYLFRLISTSSEGLGALIDELEQLALDIEQFVAIVNKPIPVSALAYRPRDYFGLYDLQFELLSTVKGRARRALIKEALETGEADTLPDFVTTPEIDTLNPHLHQTTHHGLRGRVSRLSLDALVNIATVTD